MDIFKLFIDMLVYFCGSQLSLYFFAINIFICLYGVVMNRLMHL